MTEDEARKKWCPMSRVAGYVSTGEGDSANSPNRHSSGEPVKGSLCLGSRCALWTWKNVYLETEMKRQEICGLIRHSV